MTRRPALAEIVQAAEDETGGTVCTTSRTAKDVAAREVYAAMARLLTNHGWLGIAAHAGKAHSSLLYAERRFWRRPDADKIAARIKRRLGDMREGVA